MCCLLHLWHRFFCAAFFYFSPWANWTTITLNSTVLRGTYSSFACYFPCGYVLVHWQHLPAWSGVCEWVTLFAFGVMAVIMLNYCSTQTQLIPFNHPTVLRLTPLLLEPCYNQLSWLQALSSPLQRRAITAGQTNCLFTALPCCLSATEKPWIC